MIETIIISIPLVYFLIMVYNLQFKHLVDYYNALNTFKIVMYEYMTIETNLEKETEYIMHLLEDVYNTKCITNKKSAKDMYNKLYAFVYEYVIKGVDERRLEYLKHQFIEDFDTKYTPHNMIYLIALFIRFIEHRDNIKINCSHTVFNISDATSSIIRCVNGLNKNMKLIRQRQ